MLNVSYADWRRQSIHDNFAVISWHYEGIMQTNSYICRRRHHQCRRECLWCGSLHVRNAITPTPHICHTNKMLHSHRQFTNEYTIITMKYIRTCDKRWKNNETGFRDGDDVSSFIIIWFSFSFVFFCFFFCLINFLPSAFLSFWTEIINVNVFRKTKRRKKNVPRKRRIPSMIRIFAWPICHT